MTEGARASGLTREAIEAALRPTFLPRIDSMDLQKRLCATNHPSRFSKPHAWQALQQDVLTEGNKSE